MILHQPITSSPKTSHSGLQALVSVLDNKRLRMWAVDNERENKNDVAGVERAATKNHKC